MPQTLPALPVVSQSSKRTVEHRTQSISFGNGYQQDSPDGINNRVEVWDIVYENITKAQRDMFVQVLDAAGAWDVIYWTPPGGTAKKYKMDKSGYSDPTTGNLYTLSFKLRQVF